MADIFALDVSMGKSYCVWYRRHQCLKEFSLQHTKSGFAKLLKFINQAHDPRLYFEVPEFIHAWWNAFVRSISLIFID